MVADITRTTGGEQGVRQRVQRDVRIRMTGERLLVGNEDAAERDPVAGTS